MRGLAKFRGLPPAAIEYIRYESEILKLLNGIRHDHDFFQQDAVSSAVFRDRSGNSEAQIAAAVGYRVFQGGEF